MSVDKELLFKSSLNERDVDIPGKGSVRIRSLSRAEAMSMKSLTDTAAIERRMLSIALVDPPMTEAEVGRWQDASQAGEMDVVSDAVAELSGMTPGAAKATYKEMDAEPATEFRLPPG